MRLSVAEAWHAADAEGKLEMMTRFNDNKVAVSADLLDISVSELDAYAEQLGMVKVYTPRADHTGCTELFEALVHPDEAGRYRKRGLSKA